MESDIDLLTENIKTQQSQTVTNIYLQAVAAEIFIKIIVFLVQKKIT